MFDVIPPLPQDLLRFVHPLITITSRLAVSLFGDEILCDFEKIPVAERHPGTKVSTVRQSMFFHYGDRDHRGTGHQFGLDLSQVFSWIHYAASVASISQRSR